MTHDPPEVDPRKVLPHSIDRSSSGGRPPNRANPLLVWLVFAVLALVPPMWALRKMRAAQERVNAARQEHALILREVRSVIAMHSSAPQAETASRPEQDLIRRITKALSEAGVSSQRFDSLTSLGDEPLGGRDAAATGQRAAYRRQSSQLTLVDMTVADLGRFLNQWRTDQPLWVPRRIELSRSPGTAPAARSRNTASQIGRYVITIELTLIYLAPRNFLNPAN